MLGTGQISDEIVYYRPSLMNPDNTGCSTLGAYLQSLFFQGYRIVVVTVSDFEELQIKQWGYGLLVHAGERQIVWNVELFRSLGGERWYRQLNAEAGTWITDRWSRYITDDIITIDDAAGGYGEYGVNFDFNSVYRNFIDMTGDFSAAKNAPPGFYGDGSLISCNHNQIVTQYGGNRMWYRTSNYNRTIWAPWVEVTPKVTDHSAGDNDIYVEGNDVVTFHAIGTGSRWDYDTVELPITTDLVLPKELLPSRPVRRILDGITAADAYTKQVSKLRVRLDPDGTFHLEEIFNKPLQDGNNTGGSVAVHEVFLDMTFVRGG